MRLFLDDIYDRKMKILSMINNSKQEVSIKDIVNETGLVSRTVSMIVKQFEQELDEDVFKVNYTNNIIKNVYATNIDINAIGRKYLLQSIMYKIIEQIFLYEKIDVSKFCETEYISQPTFSRRRKKLKKILQECGLNLSRENRIIGEELRIRNFYFQFFSKASNTWLFRPQEFHELNDYFSQRIVEWENKSVIQQYHISLITYISIVRSKQRNFTNNKKLIELSKKRINSPNLKTLFDYFSKSKNKTNEQIWSEASATLFILYKEKIFNDPLEVEQYEMFFSKEHFSFIEHSNIFVKKIINAFFDESTDRYLYLRVRQEIDLYHLIVKTCFIDSKKFDYVYDERVYTNMDQFEKTIREKTIRIFQQLKKTHYSEFFKQIPKYITETALIDYIYFSIYALFVELKNSESQSIKIFVQDADITMSNLLKQKISCFFGSKVKCVDRLDLNPDLIITDTNIVFADKQVEQVYINRVSEFDFLVENIERKILEKHSKEKREL
ncbi:hypothetical protein UAW_02045 [Enterococcus haemoperoxidus ATCC BAA-382]|uniref:Mga helix-turn-helix domain-containing protein n=1 Tax=Enterococcus haemoperoxidus ATCC BAA-382 TaxID=1158608 RepID=R2SQB6_9ENTE|nr:helix-turn-helix domain-containing protein [Enterococcus haemoperoxidus]EOH94966.1 hypothetical protein UAW_02045 [Enterococcus haemoperoxidus ATCC BAA-382]EOT60365.1 hypothetical protein I583_03011 [Enterococcus haemoperoxidus ATCC BAA-382]OJG54797.1 hypothetical protein RV06_GL002319 [Enterococcus haemoperoxidus]